MVFIRYENHGEGLAHRTLYRRVLGHEDFPTRRRTKPATTTMVYGLPRMAMLVGTRTDVRVLCYTGVRAWMLGLWSEATLELKPEA